TRLAAKRLAASGRTPTGGGTPLPRTLVASRATIVVEAALRTIAPRTMGRAVTKGRTTPETATGWTIAAVTGGATFEAALRTIAEIAARGTITIAGRTVTKIAARRTIAEAATGRTITLGARATLRAVAERLSFTVWLLVP